MAGKPDCPDCDGTGWKQLVRDGITAVERCGCVEVHHKETLWERAAMPARFQSAGFENFRLPRENPIAYENLGVAMNDARVFAREYPFTPKPGLMFQGNPGVGKTHLATAVMNAFGPATTPRPAPATERLTRRRSTRKCCCSTIWAPTESQSGWKTQ